MVPKANQSALSREFLGEMFDLHYNVTKNWNSSSSFDQICKKILPFSECVGYSVLRFWNFDKSKFESDKNYMRTLASSNSYPDYMDKMISQVNDMTKNGVSVSTATNFVNELNSMISTLNFSSAGDGNKFLEDYVFPFNISQVVAGVTYEKGGEEVKTGEALVMAYALRDARERNGAFSEAILEWEKHFLENMLSASSLMDKYVFTRRSGKDEGKKITEENLVYYCVACLMMVFFVSLSIGRLAWRQTRILLGLTSVLTSALGAAAGFGLFGFFSQVYSDITPSVFFLILSISVDNALIMSHYFDQLPVHLSPKDKLQRTLTSVASSIFITTATDFLAFYFGALYSNIPAFTGFCKLAA